MADMLREFDDESTTSMHSSFDAKFGESSVADIKSAIERGMEENSIVLWHRTLQFKQLSLKMLVSRILQQQQQPFQGLVIPGQLRIEDVKVSTAAHDRHHICISRHQPECATFRKELLSQVRAAPSRTQSRMLRRAASAVDGRTAPPQQLRIGVLGERGCTMSNSSNFLLLLSVKALHCKELMDDVRSALLNKLPVLTIHDKGTCAVLIRPLRANENKTCVMQIQVEPWRSLTHLLRRAQKIYTRAASCKMGNRFSARRFLTASPLIGLGRTWMHTRA
jgi:hypothetical protein